VELLNSGRDLLRKPTTWATIAGVLIISLAYAPGSLSEAAFSDDYAVFDTIHSGQSTLLFDIGNGRPLAGLIRQVSFSFMGELSDLRILRALSLMGLIATFIALGLRWRKSPNATVAIFASSIGFLLPGFMFTVQWATPWFHTWSLLLALISWGLWSRNRMPYRCLGCAGMISVFLIYPPNACFFLAVMAVEFTMERLPVGEAWSRLRNAFLLLAITLASGLLAAKFTILATGASQSARADILTIGEMPGKALWLVTRPIVTSLRPFLVDSPDPWVAGLTALPLLLLLLVGIAAQSHAISERFLSRASLVLIPLIASVLPNLITSENIYEFRNYRNLSWGVFTVASVLAVEWLHSRVAQPAVASGRRIAITRQWACGLLAAGLGLGIILHANDRYAALIGDPYAAKTTFLTRSLEECVSNRSTREVTLVSPRGPFPVLPRLGMFSMVTDLSQDWVPISNVRQLSAEISGGVPWKVRLYSPSDELGVDQSCVIRLEVLRQELLQALDEGPRSPWSLRFGS
jgi:hypothetical protein